MAALPVRDLLLGLGECARVCWERSLRQRNRVLIAPSLCASLRLGLLDCFRDSALSVEAARSQDELLALLDERVAAVVLQTPDRFGGVCDNSLLTRSAVKAGAKLITVADPLFAAHALVPASHFYLGNLQRLGLPPAQGGPFPCYVCLPPDLLALSRFQRAERRGEALVLRQPAQALEVDHCQAFQLLPALRDLAAGRRLPAFKHVLRLSGHLLGCVEALGLQSCREPGYLFSFGAVSFKRGDAAELLAQLDEHSYAVCAHDDVVSVAVDEAKTGRDIAALQALLAGRGRRRPAVQAVAVPVRTLFRGERVSEARSVEEMLAQAKQRDRLLLPHLPVFRFPPGADPAAQLHPLSVSDAAISALQQLQATARLLLEVTEKFALSFQLVSRQQAYDALFRCFRQGAAGPGKPTVLFWGLGALPPSTSGGELDCVEVEAGDLAFLRFLLHGPAREVLAVVLRPNSARLFAAQLNSLGQFGFTGRVCVDLCGSGLEGLLAFAKSAAAAIFSFDAALCSAALQQESYVLAVDSGSYKHLPGHAVISRCAFDQSGAQFAPAAPAAGQFPFANVRLLLSVGQFLAKHFSGVTLYRGRDSALLLAYLAWRLSARLALPPQPYTGFLLLSIEKYLQCVSPEDFVMRQLDYGLPPLEQHCLQPCLFCVRVEWLAGFGHVKELADSLLCLLDEMEEVLRDRPSAAGNVFANAPHTLQELRSAHWPYAYSRQKAFFPAETSFLRSKAFPAFKRL